MTTRPCHWRIESGVRHQWVRLCKCQYMAMCIFIYFIQFERRYNTLFLCFDSCLYIQTTTHVWCWSHRSRGDASTQILVTAHSDDSIRYLVQCSTKFNKSSFTVSIQMKCSLRWRSRRISTQFNSFQDVIRVCSFVVIQLVITQSNITLRNWSSDEWGPVIVGVQGYWSCICEIIVVTQLLCHITWTLLFIAGCGNQYIWSWVSLGFSVDIQNPTLTVLVIVPIVDIQFSCLVIFGCGNQFTWTWVCLAVSVDI